MPHRTFSIILLMAIHFSGLGCLTAWGQTHTHTFTGKAFGEQGELAYIEKHDITYKGTNVIKSLTTYYDRENHIIGTLLSEYKPAPQFCDYTFKDFRLGYEDGALIKKTQICLSRKETPDKRMERACLPRDEKQIVGQGFHHFIVSHLDAIGKGEIFHVKLVMPSKLDEFNFRIGKIGTENGKLLIRLEIDNWFLRLITPHVDVVYAVESGHLIRYKGISNISNGSGEYEEVRIDYFY